MWLVGLFAVAAAVISDYSGNIIMAATQRLYYTDIQLILLSFSS
jgi:hypothetical protein